MARAHRITTERHTGPGLSGVNYVVVEPPLPQTTEDDAFRLVHRLPPTQSIYRPNGSDSFKEASRIVVVGGENSVLDARDRVVAMMSEVGIPVEVDPAVQYIPMNP